MRTAQKIYFIVLVGVFFGAFTFITPKLTEAADPWRCQTDRFVTAQNQHDCGVLCAGGEEMCGAWLCGGKYYSTVQKYEQAGYSNSQCAVARDFPEDAVIDPLSPGPDPYQPPPPGPDPYAPGNQSGGNGGILERFGNYYPQIRPPGQGAGPVETIGGVLGIFMAVVNLAEVVFWILAVGFGLYGAYLYLFAAGDKESAAKARKVFIYAVIAAILAILAYGVPGIVSSFVAGY
jgi:hypothetical protein